LNDHLGTSCAAVGPIIEQVVRKGNQPMMPTFHVRLALLGMVAILIFAALRGLGLV
jgi:hypothetical protein